MINKIKNIVSPPEKFSNPALNLHCSDFEVNKWTLSDFVLKKLVPAVGTHPFPLDELMLMSAAVTYFKPTCIFEWGTHIGKSARVFYETVKAFQVPCHIHSIDLPDNVEHVEHPKHERGMLVKGIKEVTLYQGDGISKALEIYKTLKPGTPVLFFVDGDHHYDSVKRELEMILSAVQKPAVLLHDTFRQSDEAKYNTGPYHAIRDVIRGKENRYGLLSSQTGLPDMTLLFER